MGVRASKLRRIVGVGGNGSIINKRLKYMSGRRGQEQRVPKGYIPISVGVNDERRERFVVHTTALSDADFLDLLYRSAEEYGFSNQGILRIPYEAQAFQERLLIRLARPHFQP